MQTSGRVIYNSKKRQQEEPLRTFGDPNPDLSVLQSLQGQQQITRLDFTQQRGSGKSFGGQPVPRLGHFVSLGVWGESRP